PSSVMFCALSLLDALPISYCRSNRESPNVDGLPDFPVLPLFPGNRIHYPERYGWSRDALPVLYSQADRGSRGRGKRSYRSPRTRSEEHTSELQSRFDLV